MIIIIIIAIIIIITIIMIIIIITTIIMNAADKCHNNFGGDRSPGTIRKDWRKTSNMFPGKLKMHQLQKNTLLGSTSPILRKTLSTK